jgi:hypothetical protein
MSSEIELTLIHCLCLKPTILNLAGHVWLAQPEMIRYSYHPLPKKGASRADGESVSSFHSAVSHNIDLP